MKSKINGMCCQRCPFLNHMKDVACDGYDESLKEEMQYVCYGIDEYEDKETKAEQMVFFRIGDVEK